MTAKVKAALISGGMYDALYKPAIEIAGKQGIEIEVAFSGLHPEVNHHIESFADLPYDIITTHTKYAPSQLKHIAPLDGLVGKDYLADFVPSMIDLASINGKLYGLPRNIDVRLLHYRTDLIPNPPTTWDQLYDVARSVTKGQMHGFCFPGIDSGLFGTFYELAEMGGASLFPADGIPKIQNEGGRWALQLMRNMYANGVVSKELPQWNYGEVHESFRTGKAAMIGDWPGFYGAHCDAGSAVRGKFAVCAYPKGPTGKSLAYGGSHTFALTHRGAKNPAAVKALCILASKEMQLIEARNGSVPVRKSVMQTIQSEATPIDLNRWQTLADVIANHVLIPPKISYYPVIEEVIWKTVQAGMVGAIEIDVALKTITDQICQIHKEHHV